MNFMNNDRKMEILLLVFIFFFPWLFLVFQGLYISELGFWLVFYENFFTNPEISQTGFASWLTIFIGAIVSFFLGDLGVVGYKIANVFVIYIILYLVYKLLCEFTTKINLLIFLLTAEVFINIATYTYINYYNLTTLFFIISILFLYRGLIQNNLHFLFFAGFFLGLNIFIRFPNILGISIISTLFYYNFSKKYPLYHSLKQIIFTFLGYASAILTILIILILLNHYSLYINSLMILSLKANSGDVHGVSTLINKLFSTYYSSVKHAVILFLTTILILISNKFWIYKHKLNIFISLILIFLGVFSLIELSNVRNTPYYQIYDGIIGYINIFLLFIILTQFKKNSKIGLLALMSFFLMQLIPAGSATILMQSIYGMYLAIPVILVYIFSLEKLQFGLYIIRKTSIQYVGKLFISIILIYSLIVINFYYAAGIDKKRWSLNTSIDHPKLRANYMTPQRAKSLNGVINTMNFYSDDFSYILTYGSVSTLSYLSNLKPYLHNTNPFFMSEEILKEELLLREKTKSLPMIVRASWISDKRRWPKNKKEILSILDAFLKKHHYISVEKKYGFEVLIPKEK